MSHNHSSALFCQEWTVQKAGLKPEQNEDACLTRSLKREDDSPLLLIAIADGATEAVYSRLWAKKLVEAAGPDWPSLSDDDLGELLTQVCKEFSPIEPGKDVPWFVRNKYMDQGSQATLLVVTVAGSKDADSFDVLAVSVGDCCLILFKASGEVLSFPMHSSDEFGVNPVLLGNRISKPARYDRWEGRAEAGDLILIGTDAMSKWALQCLERKQHGLLFESLLELLGRTTPDFGQQVEVSASADSRPNITGVETDESSSDDLKDAQQSSKLGWFLGHLWPWSNHEPHDTAESSDDQQPLPEVTAKQSEGNGKHIVSQNTQPASVGTTSDSCLKFKQFIDRYREPESDLQMRNDDSTLVVCIPVRSASDGQEREALQVVKGLEAAVAQRLQASQQMNDVSSD